MMTAQRSSLARELQAALRYERRLLAKAAVALLVVAAVAIAHQLAPR